MNISTNIVCIFITLLVFQQLPNAAEVNIYSARKESLIKPLLEKFNEKTGIEVNLITGKADTFIKRLEIEGENTPADILLTVDAARLVRAKEKELLQEINSEVLNKVIPESLRDENSYWFGLSVRSRVIVFSPERVGVKDLFDLTYNASLELFKKYLPKLISGEYVAVDQSSLLSKKTSSFHLRKEIDDIKRIDLRWSEDKIYKHLRATMMPGFEQPYVIVKNKKIYFTLTSGND